MKNDVMDASDLRVLLCTAPAEKAEEVANALLQSRLAACVNILPGLLSLYWWKGEICRDGESLLLIKTTAPRVQELAARLVEVHPYQTPELLALSVQNGLAPYVEWVKRETERITPNA